MISQYIARVLKNSQKYWTSPAGPIAVCKFKPRLPAQLAVGTHRKGLGRMEN